MFDIFVYLFENYVHAGACPASELLARKLAAAGFQDGEIHDALDWLSGFDCEPELAQPTHIGSAARVFAAEELQVLDADCRGFLAFLENAGVLDFGTREKIIERALALAGSELIDRERLKVITLMVLWKSDLEIDALILDELLSDPEEVEASTIQ